MVDLVLRRDKGSILTNDEGDDNFLSAARGGRRNVIINGGFDVSRRGTIWLNATGSGYYVDRWIAAVSGSGSANIYQIAFAPGQTAVPGNPHYYLRYDKTVKDTLGIILRQKIEDVATLSGGKATLSFYARANNTKSMGVRLIQSFGTGGSPSSDVYIATQSTNFTTNWSLHSFTFDVPSILGKVRGTDGNDCLIVDFIEQGTADIITLDFANVQLEAGSVRTAFEVLPTSLIHTLCERYFQSSYDLTESSGASFSGGVMSVRPNVPASWAEVPTPVVFNTTMRASPTITLYDSVSGIAGKINDFYNVLSWTAFAKSISTNGFSIYITPAVTGIVSAQFNYEASAEL